MQDIYIRYPNRFANCDDCKAVTQKAKKAVDAAIANGHILPARKPIHVQIFCNNDGDGNLHPPTTSPVSMRAQVEAISPQTQRVVFCVRPIRVDCPALPACTERFPDVIEYVSE